MSDSAEIRHYGANIRVAAASHYSARGSDFGYRVARRFLFEVAGVVAENHGREDAVEILYRLGDRMTDGIGFGATVFDGEELLPGPRAALARIEAPDPELEPSGLPEHTVAFSGGTMTIQGDLGDARDQLRSALAGVEALMPEQPRWRRVAAWFGTPASWWALGGFWVGLLCGASR